MDGKVWTWGWGAGLGQGPQSRLSRWPRHVPLHSKAEKVSTYVVKVSEALISTPFCCQAEMAAGVKRINERPAHLSLCCGSCDTVCNRGLWVRALRQ